MSEFSLKSHVNDMPAEAKWNLLLIARAHILTKKARNQDAYQH